MKTALLMTTALLASCSGQANQTRTIFLTNEVVVIPRERADDFTCSTGNLVCYSEYGPAASSRTGRLECRCEH